MPNTTKIVQVQTLEAVCHSLDGVASAMKDVGFINTALLIEEVIDTLRADGNRNPSEACYDSKEIFLAHKDNM